MMKCSKIICVHRLQVLIRLKNLNIFRSIPPTDDSHQLDTQKLSTRTFFVLLFLSIITLLVYNSTVVNMKLMTVKSPSFQQYTKLQEQYSETLVCPCTKISIDYENFLQINYTLHQICTDDFLYNWQSDINRMRLEIKNPLRLDDFRWTASQKFQALTSFCRTMNATISSKLSRLYRSQYVSKDATSPTLLSTEMLSVVSQFISFVTKQFLTFLRIIRDTTQSNRLFSAYNTNAYFYFDADPVYPYSMNKFYSNCSCSFYSTCTAPSYIYDEMGDSKIYTVPDMYVGCYVIEALRQSTLQCFYNKTCLNILKYYLNVTATSNTTVLNKSSLMKFSPTDTIGRILDELMVETWNWSSSYQQYFRACNPSQCTYSLKTRNDAIYVFTALMGLIGGLVTALKLIVPRVVGMIREKLKTKSHSTSETENVQRSKYDVLKHYLHQIRMLNIFPSIPPSNNPNELETQRISTRVFLILLGLSLSVLLVYNSTMTVSKTINIEMPSFEEYLNLEEKYSETLVCPCTQISVGYQQFLSINYTLHQVCSSTFVTRKWFDYLRQTSPNLPASAPDFKVKAAYIFQALQLLCRLASSMVSTSLQEFYTKEYVTTSVIEAVLFQSDIVSIIKQFIAFTIDDFLLFLRVVRDSTHENFLFSPLFTNAYLYSTEDAFGLLSEPRIYDNCSCISRYACVAPANIFGATPEDIVFSVPGMYVGCYIIEALRQSTLECFFNQTCFDQFKFYTNLSLSWNATILNKSSLMKFSPTDTIGRILDELMVETWNWSSSYQQYFRACNPSQCTYSLKTRNDAIYVFTALMGLIGGLVTALKLIVPRVVALLRKTRVKVENISNIDIGTY